MKLYDYTNIENLLLVGDIHGEFRDFIFYLKRNLKETNNKPKVEIEEPIEVVEQPTENNDLPLTRFGSVNLKVNKTYFNDSIIIVAGDCGFGFNKPKYYEDNLKDFNEILSLNNCHIIFVRGNHDDPSYFEEEKINMSNIKTVPDYSVIKTKNLTTLCVGGAISVDRLWRKTQEQRINKYSKNKKKQLYWDNEQNVYDESKLIEIAENGLEIDSVVTHTAPTFAYPKQDAYKLSWFKLDEKLKNDVALERQNLDKIFDFLTKNQSLKLKFWGYGHFHEQHQDLREETLFLALDMSFRVTNPIKMWNEYMSLIKVQKELKAKKKIQFPKFSMADFPRTEAIIADNPFTDEVLDELGDDPIRPRPIAENEPRQETLDGRRDAQEYVDDGIDDFNEWLNDLNAEQENVAQGVVDIEENPF